LCLDIARDAMKLEKEGKSPVEIRRTIEARYDSHDGKGTHTPWPAETKKSN